MVIRQVRLFRSVRYRRNFTPREWFQSDSLALSHLDALKGNPAFDAAEGDERQAAARVSSTTVEICQAAVDGNIDRESSDRGTASS